MAMDSLWTQAISLYKEGKFAEACAKFEEWRSQESLVSRDASLNLALCYSKSFQWDKSGAELIDVIRMTSNPISRLTLLTELEDMQDRIGLKESPARSWTFKLSEAVPSAAWVFAASIALWGILLPLLTWKKAKGHRPLLWTLMAISFLTLLSSSAMWAMRYLAPKPAILTSEKPDIPVYAKAVASDDGKMIDLPRGSLILVGEISGDFVKSNEPLVGWVPKQNVILK